MKLLITAALGQLVVGETMLLQVPTSLSEFFQFFTSPDAANLLGPTDFPQIFSHGCYCKRFSDFNSSNRGGQPVDALDAICKNYWERKACIKQSGGTCDSYYANGNSYPESHYSATLNVVNGVPQISQDVNFHCQAVTNPCSRDQCEICHAAILSITGNGLGTASHNFQPNAQCSGNQLPNAAVSGFTCVGSGAGATWAYEASIPTQLEHANAFFSNAEPIKMFEDVAFTQIMDHGCHCKKLGDHDAEIQGGSTVVDDLDKRCKDFFMRRQCLKSSSGFSGSCSDGYGADTYTALLRVTDVNRVLAGEQFPGMFSWFSDRQVHCSALEEGTCLYDVCNVDHDSIYRSDFKTVH